MAGSSHSTQRGRAVAARQHSSSSTRTILLLGGVMLLLPLIVFSLTAVSGEQRAPVVGQTAPQIAAVAVDGSPIDLDALRGNVVLINFWATWCPPCRAEMPAIEAAYQAYAAQGFEVIAVTNDQNPELVPLFLREFGLTFPAVLDRDNAINAAYRVNGLPTSLFIDRSGTVRAVHHGQMTQQQIEADLLPLLAEAADGS
jgi:cytochrome c biogenesis protein CcmG/thiol:disulfide interchange protein DsbE